MLIEIHIKYHEDILTSFQVTEQTHFFVTDKAPREIIKKSINVRIMVLVLCMSSNVD